MTPEFNRRPDFRGARQRVEDMLRRQLHRDMWAGRSVPIKGRQTLLLSMPMWKIDEYARLLAHQHAKTGTARHELTEARIQKLARGEAL